MADEQTTTTAALLSEGCAAYESALYEQAAACFKKAAEQGSAEAQARLGFLYEKGLGVAQDNVQSAAWFRRAAARRFPQK